MVKKHIDSLLESPLFLSFDKMTLRGMTSCLQMYSKEFKKGAYIINRGQTYRYIGIIVAGKAAIVKDNALGQRMIIELLTVGSVFGEMSAFSKQNIWHYSVQSQSDCTVVFIPKDRIIGECAKLCPCHRVLVENFLTIISERGIFLDKKIEYLSIKSVVGKISAYLYDQYKLNNSYYFDIPLNRGKLAEYLNVSRPTLSRELARLRDENVLDFYLNTFKLKDITKLKRLGNIG